MSTTGKGGFYRKQVYEHIEAVIGRVLTKEEHRALRLLLKQYVNERTEDYQARITDLSNDLKKCRHAFKNKRHGNFRTKRK